MAERIAIVTGAGSGIGRACAVTLQDNGYHVVLAGRRMQALQETAALARPGGGRMQPVACDVTDPASVNELFVRTRESFGRLDVLFDNAGNCPPPTPPDDVPFAVWQAAVAVNLTGALSVCASRVSHDEVTRSERRPMRRRRLEFRRSRRGSIRSPIRRPSTR